MTEADIGMTEHRSKNTLGRSVPVKTKTDVEEDGTSPRPVCTAFWFCKAVLLMLAMLRMRTIVLDTLNVYSPNHNDTPTLMG